MVFGSEADQSFENCKISVDKSSCLAYYNRRKPIVVSGDASRAPRPKNCDLYASRPRVEDRSRSRHELLWRPKRSWNE